MFSAHGVKEASVGFGSFKHNDNSSWKILRYHRFALSWDSQQEDRHKQMLVQFLMFDSKSVQHILRHAEHWIHLQILWWILVDAFRFCIHTFLTLSSPKRPRPATPKSVWKGSGRSPGRSANPPVSVSCVGFFQHSLLTFLCNVFYLTS